MVDTTFYTSFRIRKQNAICAKYYIPLIIHRDFKAFRLEYANKCNVSIRQCFANVQYIKRQKNGIEIVYWNHFSHSNEHLLEFYQWLVGNWLYICMQWKLNWFFPLNGLEHTHTHLFHLLFLFWPFSFRFVFKWSNCPLKVLICWWILMNHGKMQNVNGYGCKCFSSHELNL